MKNSNVALGIALMLGALCIAFLVGADGRYYAGRVFALVLISLSMTVLLLAMARGPNRGGVMAGHERMIEGEDRPQMGSRPVGRLSRDDMEELAELAAAKALEKVYAEVGKNVLRKTALVIGSIVIALLLWFGKNHIDLK